MTGRRRRPAPALVGGPEAFAEAFAVSRETLDRLRTYEERLRTWQRTMNLVAASTLDGVWHRHFADSAQLVVLAPAAIRWVDLGSGAGFPGLVIAVLLAERGEARVSLVESDQRKCAFLAEVVRAMGFPHRIAVDIVPQRIEQSATRARVGEADAITARALAPMERLLALAAPLFGKATVGLFLKGRTVEVELAAAERRWRFDGEVRASRTEADGRVVIVRSLAHKTED